MAMNGAGFPLNSTHRKERGNLCQHETSSNNQARYQNTLDGMASVCFRGMALDPFFARKRTERCYAALHVKFENATSLHKELCACLSPMLDERQNWALFCPVVLYSLYPIASSREFQFNAYHKRI